MKTLSQQEMQQVQGGCSTADLIAAAWNACPEGGRLSVTNEGDGVFIGSSTSSDGFICRVTILQCNVYTNRLN
jgi:bacteriocin-like protein